MIPYCSALSFSVSPAWSCFGAGKRAMLPSRPDALPLTGEVVRNPPYTVPGAVNVTSAGAQ